MLQINKVLDSKLATGVAIGIGLAIIIPVAVSAIAPLARPLARSAIRAGALAYEKARESVAEFGEMAQDVVAEAQEELRVHNTVGMTDAADEESSEPT